MRPARDLLRALVWPAILLLVFSACGAALAWAAKRTLASDHRTLAAAQAERRSAHERLARLGQEEREVHEHLEIYRRLKDLRILGEERRLEWLDALARIRRQRALLDLRYQIDPQKPMKREPAVGELQVRSSTMKVELALLHEGDLLHFLEDLRASGGAYYAVRRCSIHRSPFVAGKPAAPSLRSTCEIDLITMAETKGRT